MTSIYKNKFLQEKLWTFGDSLILWLYINLFFWKKLKKLFLCLEFFLSGNKDNVIFNQINFFGVTKYTGSLNMNKQNKQKERNDDDLDYVLNCEPKSNIN